MKPNVDIYITGSNAYMLSGDLATLLTGRYVEIKMLPLSLKEFLTITGMDEERGFAEYLKCGGLPYVARDGAHHSKSGNLFGGHLQYRYRERHRR